MADEKITHLKSFKFRLYPSRSQARRLDETLALCCELYNAGLQERGDAYKLARKSIRYVEQANQLPEIKEIRPELKDVHSLVLQDVLRRLELAFQSFFSRLKEGRKPGFPRFKSRSRYSSLTYTQSGFAIEAGKLRLSKIGRVKIKLHRPIKGKIKTVTISRTPTGKWFASLAVECQPEPLPLPLKAVGVDCGLAKFAVLSSGEQIQNPRFFRTEEKRLARAQRGLSALARNCPEGRKRRKVVGRIHERIANKRRDFAHQESRKLVNRFSIIVFEKLNIRGMVRNHRLAKSISDAAWNQFVRFTLYKAENAGGVCVRVDPRDTTKKCSGCGKMVVKELDERVHACPNCRLVIDRDLNAAINILRLGLEQLGLDITYSSSRGWGYSLLACQGAPAIEAAHL